MSAIAAMEQCLFCMGSKRGALAVKVHKLLGAETCVACDGYGEVPVIVQAAWIRGESGAAEWELFEGKSAAGL